MDLKKCVKEIKTHYPHWKTQSRIIGEAAELWVEKNLSCPICYHKGCDDCDNSSLKRTRINTKSVDVICQHCSSKFQVKIKKGSFLRKSDNQPKKIISAEYNTTLKHIQTKPSHILILSYDKNQNMKEINFIHSTNVKPSFVIPRKPLPPTAKRAGWQGCYLNFPKDVIRAQKVSKQEKLFEE